MKKLPTIFLGVGLILATVPRVMVEKTDDHFLLTVGGAVTELIVRRKEKRCEKKSPL
jgi:hypothetical protein